MIPRVIPEGTSPYLAESLRQRRAELDSQSQGARDAAARRGITVGQYLIEQQEEAGQANKPEMPWLTETYEEMVARILGNYKKRLFRGYMYSTARRLNAERRDIDPISREEIMERDGYVCYLCGKECSHDEIHIDHVMPISRGGKHVASNLRVACSTCNLRKRSFTLSEYRARLEK